MIKTVKIKDTPVVLDTDATYIASGTLTDQDKLIRKVLKLPIKKDLVYYRNIHAADSTAPVTSYRILSMYDVADPWYTLELTLADNTTVNIHSTFFADMQKPSFIADIIASEKAAND